MEEQILQALQNGTSPEEVVQALMQDGMSQGEATQAVQSVMQQAQEGAQGGGAEGGAPAQAQGLSADQAIEALSQLGVQPQVIIETLKIILSMTGPEIEKLLVALQQGGEAQGQGQTQGEIAY